MLIFFVMTTLVGIAIGAAAGALMAYFLPRVFLYVMWGALLAAGIVQYLQSRGLDEHDRMSADMLVFAVMLPLLIGSLITGFLVKRRQASGPV